MGYHLNTNALRVGHVQGWPNANYANRYNYAKVYINGHFVQDLLDRFFISNKDAFISLAAIPSPAKIQHFSNFSAINFYAYSGLVEDEHHPKFHKFARAYRDLTKMFFKKLFRPVGAMQNISFHHQPTAEVNAFQPYLLVAASDLTAMNL